MNHAVDFCLYCDRCEWLLGLDWKVALKGHFIIGRVCPDCELDLEPLPEIGDWCLHAKGAA